MTRINVIPVQELSDQWLIAEYRELPRALKGNFSLKNAPENYVLGTGHIKWARKYALFTHKRMYDIIKEMDYRGFKHTFSADLSKYITLEMNNDYKVRKADVELNRARLIKKYLAKPSFYRWTKRNKPTYLQGE